MKTTQEYLDIINDALLAVSYPVEPADLYDPVKYQLDMGGKRVRPLLALIACDMCGGCVDDVLPAATGIEIFHNFTLLHDDVMDKADIRRGRPTVHKAWSENVAILSGDAMQIISYQMIGRTPADVLKPVFDLFSATALQICEGQQYDMDFEGREDVTEDEYISMIRLKTAVLLGCALKTGAYVAHAPQETADALYRFGENLGLAFQLQDDYLDVYGEPSKFGKKIGGDILNNKKTYMLISAMRMAEGEEREELARLLNSVSVSPEDKIKGVTSLYTSLGIDRLAMDKIDFYYRNALAEIEGIPGCEPLRLFASELMQRES